MRGNELLDKMELADPAYVEAADRKPLRQRRGWIPWAAAAACLCLLIAAIPVFSLKPSTPQEGTTDYGGPPRVAVNGRTYVISPYLANAEELPDGFTYAGTTDVDNGFEDCAYYTNPDIPEWIYVYQEVRTDGTVDETGTLVSTPPHNAYTRYVDERLRGKKLVCFDGNYYISMWSAWYSGEDPDVIEAYYEKIYEQYGIQIEGAVPDGFTLAGTAAFSGDDTVPKGTLASNEGEVEVYYDASNPEVILVEAHWFTVQGAHDGFDVYILYDCPFADQN